MQAATLPIEQHPPSPPTPPAIRAVPEPHSTVSGEARHDLALMRRVTAGDQEAFAELFDRHAPVVLGLLTRMLGHGGQAEEVLQECFVQAWTQAGRYRPEGASVRGWLILLARSRALDRLRSRAARARREQGVYDRGVLRTWVPAVGTSALERRELRRRVVAALAELPAEQRACVELAYFEGLSHSQIAAALGAPLGTVKSRVLAGMRRLRKSLAAPGRTGRTGPC